MTVIDQTVQYIEFISGNEMIELNQEKRSCYVNLCN